MATTFGAALRDRRQALGVSQRELAKRVALDFSYISKVENDRVAPPAADTIVAICKALGIEAEELLALTGKLPSGVHESVATSKAAQEFLRDVRQLNLTDQEWEALRKKLVELRSLS